MGSSSRVFASAMVALVMLSSTVAQDPRSLDKEPKATPAPGLFGFTFPSLNNIGVPCLGSSSLSAGTCRKDADECMANGGAIDGTCVAGFGQCCVQPLKCGAIALTNGSFLANSNYPKATTENTQCTLTINKIGNIKQIRLELIKFQVGAPDAQGKCNDDFMMIQSGLSPGASIPRLCGINYGQHIILPVEQSKDLTVVIRFSISGRSKSTWLIQAIQQHSLNPLVAPDNCLQYHTGPTGNMKSLSTGANLDALRYSICFRRETDYCSIKFTFKPSTGAIGTADNTTTPDNSTATESRKRREANGNYGAGQYAAPQAFPQQHVPYPPQYAHPAQNVVPQRPVQQGHYQHGYQVPIAHPVKPVVGYRPPYHPHPLFPSTGMVNATVSSVMPTSSTGNTTDSGTTDATDATVTDGNVPIVTSSPAPPALNCDDQDIVTFPPSTIVCDNNMATTTPITIDTSRLIVFVDNRGKPTHQTGWKYDYSYQSC